MKKLFTCIALLSCIGNPGTLFAQKRITKATHIPQQATQTQAGKVWTSVPLSQAPNVPMRARLKRYSQYQLNVPALRAQFWALSRSYENASVIDIPMPNGTTRAFRVWETPMMEESMAALYPDIKTFTGEAVDDKRVTAKFDFTLFGFHSVVFDGNEVAFIDPYDQYNDGYYVLHYKSDEDRPYSQRMVCELHNDNELHTGKMQLLPTLPSTDLAELKIPSSDENIATGGIAPSTPAAYAVTSSSNIRSYRLALSANNHYCRAATGLPTPTIAQCLSTMTTSMNRVNGVYNRELAVQFNFVANETLIIWPTATGSSNGADPFDAINSSAGSCISQNQITCDTRIGSGSYDVGHVFTTGAGGLASLGVICNNSAKAQGVTGSSSPVGDSYDIDYVCHELGHQFGSNHTFNNNLDGACSGNASSPNAYEPASGATIMDYAGICSPDNVQPNSSPYFSARSLDRINTHISGSGGSCATTIPSGHSALALAPFIASYNIPYKTPFELTSPTATAGSGDTAITYCWHQANLGDFGQRLNTTFVWGPIFRSYQPDYDATREFPRLSNILSGILSNSGEKAPDTTRYLTFKTVVRNIRAGMGCFNIPDDTVHLNAYSTGAANGYTGFRVTSQNTAVTYTGGSTQTITWNVVGTNNPPVNAANVDIFMSTDGGNTWPYAIGTFPNTGSASVSIPNPPTTTTTARIKVKGSGNVFFNINGSNFTVNPGATTAPITGTFTVCVTGTTDLDDATPSGTWSSSTPAVGTVNSTTGVVTGISAGTTTITYHVGTGNVTAVVTVIATPTVAATTGTAVVCTGLTTTLSNTTAGGVWSSTTPAVGTVNTSGVVNGIAAGTTTISYTVSNGCGTIAATRVVTVNSPVAVAAITGTSSVCVGGTTALSNTTPSGAWSSSNTTVGTVSGSGSVSGLSAGTTTVSYTVTGGGCTSASSVVVTVNSTPVASTSPSGTVTICTGGSQVFTASPSTTGLTFQWQNGGVDIPGETNATYTATTAGTYRVRISNGGCAGTSATATVNVSGTTIVPSVTVVTSPGTTICSAVGTVTFTATPVNGGTPTYQWYVNGTPSGTSSPTFSYLPANGDIVRVEMTSSLPCASPSTVSDADTMNVTTSVTPGVTADPIPNDTVCTGTSVTYNAIPVNGGATPSFIWSRNGTNVGTGTSYTTIPSNGDVIVVQMTGSAPCASATIVNSTPLTMTVAAPATNTVSISGSPLPFTPGETVTFAAIAPFAGPAGVYQWYVNSIAVAGATSATYVTNTLNVGDAVHCKVTTSLPCVSPHIVLSNGITMTVGIWEVTKGGSSFAIIPNPNNGTFTVNGKLNTGNSVDIALTNVLGQTIFHTVATTQGNRVNENVTLPINTPAGTYMVIITTGSDRAVFKMTIEK